MGQANLLTPAERARALVVLNRIRQQAKVGGRFQQIRRKLDDEDNTFSIEVHIHDGPEGHGRTVVIEKQVGNILFRRTVGDESHGRTEDWREIDLSTVV